MQTIEIVKTAVAALNGKKAEKIEALKVDDLTIIADYFVIASANNSTLVKALAEEVEFQLEQKGLRPNHIEGRATQWILLDYGSVVVHIFYEAAREFYALERLWQDAEKLDVSQLTMNSSS